MIVGIGAVKHAGCFCSGWKILLCICGFFHGLVIFISQGKSLLRSDILCTGIKDQCN